MATFYPSFVLLMVLAFVCTPLITIAWIILYRRQLLSLRLMALSFFVICILGGIGVYTYFRDMWLLLAAALAAILGSVMVLLLPKIQPKVVDFLKLKL